MNILAGATSRIRFKPGVDAVLDPLTTDDKGSPIVLVPAVADCFVDERDADAVGPIFTIKTLGYFDYHAALELDGQPAIVAEFLRLGLVEIAGATVGDFLANPSARIVPALFNAIFEASAGN